jgi:hypothetical protein
MMDKRTKENQKNRRSLQKKWQEHKTDESGEADKNKKIKDGWSHVTPYFLLRTASDAK